MVGDYGYRESESPYMGLVWWAEIDEDADYVDAANEFWGLAFARLPDGSPSATLIGPSLEPRELHLRAGERGLGVELAAHVFVRALSKRQLLNEMRDLPTDGRWFELAGVRLPVPDIDTFEGLVPTLLRQGILAADENVAAALAGHPAPYSSRTVHRHVMNAAGIGPKKLEQLKRARDAYTLLQNGWSLAEAALEAGFSDQAHMTRAFTGLAGQSPAKIMAGRPTPFDSRP